MKRGITIIELLVIAAIVAIVVAVAASIISGSNDPQMKAAGGGTSSVDLGPGMKLMSAQWLYQSYDNQADKARLWVLVRQRKDGEEPDKYIYYHPDTDGSAKGQVIIVEH